MNGGRRRTPATTSTTGNYSMDPEWVFRACTPYPNANQMRAVYWYINLRADRSDNTCFPSQETIAEAVGCSERTVRRALDNLFEIGAIEWSHRVSRNGRTSNHYLVHHEMPERYRSPMSGTDRTPVTGTTRTPVTGEHEPVNNNQYEHESPTGSDEAPGGARKRKGASSVATRTPASADDTSIGVSRPHKRQKDSPGRPAKSVKREAMRKLIQRFADDAFGFYKEHESEMRQRWDWHQPNSTLLMKVFGEIKREGGYSDDDVADMIRLFFVMLDSNQIKWRNAAQTACGILVTNKRALVAKFEKNRGGVRETKRELADATKRIGRGVL